VTNWNVGQELPDIKSELEALRQSCVDYAPYLFEHVTSDATQLRQNNIAIQDLRLSPPNDSFFDKKKCKHQPQIELLLGTETGTVCCYDPYLLESGIVVKYNNLKEVKKQHKVDHIRWFEAKQEGTNSNKFIVVFDDGTFQVFFRTLYDKEKKLEQVIRIPMGNQPDQEHLYARLNDPNF